MVLTIAIAQPTSVPDLGRLHGIVQDFHARLSSDIFRCDWLPSELEILWAARLTDPKCKVFIAMIDSTTVGYIWFEILVRERDATHISRGRMHVHHIVVDEIARGEGVGERLLAQAELEAGQLGISDITLDAWASNSIAQAFFCKRGYEPVYISLTKKAEAF